MNEFLKELCTMIGNLKILVDKIPLNKKNREILENCLKLEDQITMISYTFMEEDELYFNTLRNIMTSNSFFQAFKSGKKSKKELFAFLEDIIKNVAIIIYGIDIKAAGIELPGHREHPNS